MFLSRMFHSINTSMEEHAVIQIVELNEKTRPYGLTLSPDEARQLITVRNEVLRSYGRIELGLEATKELIVIFSDSPYIHQGNYLTTLNELHELFYNLRNDTEDKIGDHLLMEWMKETFDGDDCGGSLELLKSRLQEYAEQFRRELQADELLGEGGDDEWR